MQPVDTYRRYFNRRLETVREYETNTVASDSEDERKIYKAEAWALKRKLSSSHGKDVVTTSYSRNDVGSYTGAKFLSTNDFPFQHINVS